MGLCRKAGNNVTVLATLLNFRSSTFSGILLKTFMEFQFGFWPLIWMFHSRRNKKYNIDHLQERSLCIVYKDSYSSCMAFLTKEKQFTMHEMNI